MRSMLASLSLIASLVAPTQALTSDPLPSWNAGVAKAAIVTFVSRVTTPGTPDYVPIARRIATFDNDGTLWPEKPLPTEFMFMLARTHRPPPKTPADINALVIAAETGMTTAQFSAAATTWLASARDPRTHCLYIVCVYQPMLELLAYLRANGFKTYIVSGGTVDFMRAFTQRTYGIPPEQVVGTTFETKYAIAHDQPVLLRLPKINLVDDGPGKAIAIQRYIGVRPIAAFGNSDGDQEMLEWVAAGPGARLLLLVHHDDAVREYAYDRNDELAKLERVWDEALRRGWVVVSMKQDWKTIYPPH